MSTHAPGLYPLLPYPESLHIPYLQEVTHNKLAEGVGEFAHLARLCSLKRRITLTKVSSRSGTRRRSLRCHIISALRVKVLQIRYGLRALALLDSLESPATLQTVNAFQV